MTHCMREMVISDASRRCINSSDCTVDGTIVDHSRFVDRAERAWDCPVPPHGSADSCGQRLDTTDCVYDDNGAANLFLASACAAIVLAAPGCATVNSEPPPRVVRGQNPLSLGAHGPTVAPGAESSSRDRTDHRSRARAGGLRSAAIRRRLADCASRSGPTRWLDASRTELDRTESPGQPAACWHWRCSRR